MIKKIIRVATAAAFTPILCCLSAWCQQLPVEKESSELALSGKISAKPAATSSDLDQIDLTEVGLKELLDLDLVVSAPGRKAQSLAEVPSAIYVLSSEDIRRSGVTHIAEALRLVPGVNVARVSASQWAISIRGFNQIYSHRLLVLVDGMSVFSPLTNGVYWETLDLPVQDLERIEVVRGPGAALWGSNAVNGVINIVTKKSSDTKGTLVAVSGGSPERFQATARHGLKLSDSTDARFTVRTTHLGDNDLVAGGNANDDWSIGSVNARVDSKISADEDLRFFANGFSERDEVQASTPVLTPPFVDTESFSGKGKWFGGYTGVNYENRISSDSNLNVLLSTLYQKRESALISLDYSVTELDATYRKRVNPTHDLLFGVSSRLYRDSVDGTYAQDLLPSSRVMPRYNAFLQDDLTIIPERLHLVVGSKFEHNDSTGFEFMPSVRTIWTPDSKNSVWAAFSRSVAPPSRVFDDIQFPVAAIPGSATTPPTVVSIFGDRKVSAEVLLAYELGYRSKLTQDLSLDVAAFFSKYDNTFTQEPTAPFFGTPNMSQTPALIVPLRFANGFATDTFGGELTLEYRLKESWKVSGSYSYIQAKVYNGQSQDQGNELIIGGSAPVNSVILRSSSELTDSISLDVYGRYQDSLALGEIPSYIEADSNLIWKVNSNLSFSVLGQNLLDSAHQEYAGNLFGPKPTAIRRTVFGTVTLQF